MAFSAKQIAARAFLALAFSAASALAQAEPFWIGGQANVIIQQHGAFASPYEGPNSLHPVSERAMSRVFTIYSALALSRSDELLVDVESAGGRGISDALGLAGFTNLDVVRNPQLGARPYLARAELHHVFALGGETEEAEKTPLSRFPRLPSRRVEVRLGKMSTVDIFDANNVGSDSHLQFLNWTIDDNGAYDYAADTRGYTIGASAEVTVPRWTTRVGVMMMPTVANGIELEHNLRRARGQNVEVEWRPAADTAMRLLVYQNIARMGSYREALASGAPPDITLSRRDGRTKSGIGLNAERALTERLRAFARLGWSDGRNESFAYTEVDRAAEAGFDVRPLAQRAQDKIGFAVDVNGLAQPHRDYLRAGGLGFLLGDGTLRYGAEQIAEAYYNAFLGHGVSVAVDVQHIRNPGYNRDRGPVTVPAARLHVDF